MTIDRFYLDYINRINFFLDTISLKTLNKIVDEILYTDIRKRSVYMMGNGGSASIASHFTCDLRKRGISAYSLADNISSLTAYANDYGYENVFLEQLKLIKQSGNLYIFFSSSGNSKNCIKAISYLKSKNETTVSFLGFDGGVMKDISDISLIVKTEKGRYGEVESIHTILTHVIANSIKNEFEYEM